MDTRETYIRTRRPLFWSVAETNLGLVSDELLVETILNYGSLEDVRGLIAMLGLGQTAAVFRRTALDRARHNYFPQTANFFKLYFNRHAPADFVR